MLSNHETNFYIRRDSDEVLWSGISLNIQDGKYNSYKLSCFIKKESENIWNAHQTELIIFDKENNMYTVTNYKLNQLYNNISSQSNFKLMASFSKVSEDYMKSENIDIYIDKSIIKSMIDELRCKSNQAFGVNIKI